MKIKFSGDLPVSSAHLLRIQGPAIVGGDWQLACETLDKRQFRTGKPWLQGFRSNYPGVYCCCS
jgi:hypothetical protein